MHCLQRQAYCTKLVQKRSSSSALASRLFANNRSAVPSGLQTRAMVASIAPAGTTTAKVPGARENPWGQEKLDYKYPQLNGDMTVDVCIIGAGLAGLTTAYRLAKAGKSVAVLESRARGAGHTGRSLGHIPTWNDRYYSEIIKIANVERARLVAQSHASARDFIAKVIKDEGIKCEYEEVPGYLMPHHGRGEWATKEGVACVDKEATACQQLGVDAHMENMDLGVGGSTNVLAFPKSANINPVQYIEGLAEAATRNGVKIFENTRARGGVLTGPSKGRVQTFNGHTVTATEGVVLATRSPINRDQLWVHNRQLAYRMYIIALEVPAGSVPNAHFYDTAEVPHTARLVNRGKGQSPLLLVQGARHLHGVGESKIGKPYEALEQWARHHFPKSGRVVHQWSTQDYFPADLLGLYGQDPFDNENPPNYILTGHSGQEWIGATFGSEVVSDMILKKSSPYFPVYKPGRVFATPKYIPELATYFSTVGVALAKHLVPRSLEDVKGFVWPSAVEKDLKPGDGKVVQHGWRKKALYLDYENQLHVKSALCTHLGCCVEWNPLDKTFDCPCHGSEYDACGRCIHAPAVADLEDLGSRQMTPR